MAEIINIAISTDSPAFEAAPASEIARILRRLAEQFERDGALPSNYRVLHLRDVHNRVCGQCDVRPIR